MDTVAEGFIESVRRDPLFAAEGMDIERAEAALDAVESVAGEFEEAMGRNSLTRRLFLTRYPLTRYAVPVSFVRAFIECERLRRRFLSYPTASGGEQLLQTWESAREAYSADLARFTRMHRILFNLDGKNGEVSPMQDMHGNTSTPSDIDDALRMLRANAECLRVELRERRDLFSGKGYIQTSEQTGAQKELEYRPCPAPARYTRLHELELAHVMPYRYGTILERHGPLSYELSQFDGKPTVHPFMLYILRDNRSDLTTLKVASLDTFLFLPIGPDAKVAELRTLAHVRGKGVPYWYQCATNLYTSRDQTYWADIATVVDLERRPWLEKKALLSQRSSLLDLLLGACAVDHRLILENAKDHLSHGTFTSRHAWYWLLMRTHPSLYYLPFNKSVWRMNEQVNFLGSGRATVDSIPYLPVDVVLPTLTPHELELVMEGGRMREDARQKQG